MRIQKVLSEGVQLWRVFFLFCFVFSLMRGDKGRKDPNTPISGQSSARQRNAIKMAFR